MVANKADEALVVGCKTHIGKEVVSFVVAVLPQTAVLEGGGLKVLGQGVAVPLKGAAAQEEIQPVFGTGEGELSHVPIPVTYLTSS